MPDFTPGLELSRRFYFAAVRPILDAHYAGLRYCAAHIGTGSDVLGFDTAMSRDHGWGPTVTLFLHDADIGQAGAIRELLRGTLPHSFLGYPVGMAESPEEPGTLVMAATDAGPMEHRVNVTTVRDFAWAWLRYDVDQPIAAADWLTFPAQTLRALTAGAVHYDGAGELTALRERLAYYPRDVWLYLLAAGWQRIGQEEHLALRAGYAGDELGSALIGSRLVRDLMSLCFLMERVYAPYPKWFGTAFQRLACAAELAPLLWRAQLAATWREREAALAPAYEYVARLHNALGITEEIPAAVANFFGRPFKVIWGSRIAEVIAARIADPEVKRIAARGLIGSIDQWSDSTDIRSEPEWRAVLRKLYE